MFITIKVQETGSYKASNIGFFSVNPCVDKETKCLKSSFVTLSMLKEDLAFELQTAYSACPSLST